MYSNWNNEFSQIPKHNKTILITGAGSGLGRGAALGLAKQGFNVIAGVEIWPQYSNLKKEVENLNINMEIVKLDITNKEEREKVVNDYGNYVDILVNNAAIGETGPMAEVPVDNFRKNMEVNVFSTLELTQLFIKKFIPKKRGKIIFISSIAGIKTFPFFGPYCSTKFALEAVSSSLYEELKPYGIKVSTINPGPYRTGFNDRMFDTKDIWFSNKRNFTNYKVNSKLEYDKKFNLVSSANNCQTQSYITSYTGLDKPIKTEFMISLNNTEIENLSSNKFDLSSDINDKNLTKELQNFSVDEINDGSNIDKVKKYLLDNDYYIRNTNFYKNILSGTEESISQKLLGNINNSELIPIDKSIIQKNTKDKINSENYKDNYQKTLNNFELLKYVTSAYESGNRKHINISRNSTEGILDIKSVGEDFEYIKETSSKTKKGPD